jgi:geranylgeranylglycerol-phosphate geranylgeranyltransferase
VGPDGVLVVLGVSRGAAWNRYYGEEDTSASMRGYLRLSRPGNAVMSGVGVVIAALVAAGPGPFVDRVVPVALAAIAALLFTAAGNALNDYFDRGTDRTNHPDRPIPRGEVSPDGAVRFSSLLFALSLVASSYVGLAAVGIVALNLVAMVSYEKLFKARGASGNVLIAYLAGSIFVFGGVAVAAGDPGVLQRAFLLGLLAALATAGREVTKDIEDLAGDVDRATLPRKIGVPTSGRVAAACFLAGVVLSVVPFGLGLFEWPYLAIVAVADIMFIYSGVYSARIPGLAQRTAKYGMAVALVAFLAGGLLA